MTRRRPTAGHLLLLLWVFCLWPGSEAAAETPVVIAVVVNKKNSVKNISRAELKDIFLKRRQSWGGGRTIVPINNALKSKLRRIFEQKMLGMSSKEVGAYWVKQSITGRATPPRSVGTEVLARRLVAALSGAISYIELSKVDSSVKVLSVDNVAPSATEYKYKYSPKAGRSK
jgi:ABC-type phosphate transport system substrate-binding protein